MKNKSETKTRLYLLADKLGLNPSQFSIRIGKDRTYLSNISKEIQTDVLRNIYIEFPQSNISWIITGEGDMLLQKSEKALQSDDASLLLSILNKEIAKKEKLEEENKKLLKEKEDLKDYVNKLNLEILNLKNKLEIETSPKSKVV